MNNIHDKGYKDLYSNKDVFINLVKDTLKFSWASEIKPEDLILVDKSYILPNYHDKESDIVYRAKIEGEEVIFFTLLEFQSTVDYSMPIRLFFYISEILRREIDPKEIKAKKKNISVPAVVPIVLYNGKRPWDAKVSFRKIISKEEMFSKGLIDFTYDLIDVNNGYSKEQLLNFKNITGAIFLLDQKVNEEEFLERIKLIALTFHKISKKERKALIHWITQTTEDTIAKSSKEVLLANKEEIIKVVANNSNIIKEMKEKAENKGLKEGIEKGKVEIVIKLLSKKFNNIPDYYKEKLLQLDESVIDTIALEIFDMDSIEDLNKYISN